MKRRNSTKSHAPSRQKSSSSVRSVQLVHIHPDTAEHDAQNAAIQAFARAKERSSNSIAHWPPPRSCERPTTGSHRSSPEIRQDRSGVCRQQSVRFVQPKSSRACLEEEPAQYTPSKQASTRARTTRLRSQTQPSSNASAGGMALASKGTAGDYINALITGEEYYTPVDNIASVPSSYRRLRKSKSYAGRQLADVQSDTRAGGTRLKAPRSMNFLKTQKEISTCGHRKYDTQKTSPLEGNVPSISPPRTTRSHSVMPVQPKSAKPSKFLRKTLRDVSIGTSSMSTKGSRDESLRLRARRVSHSFKHKLKNFFNISDANHDSRLFPPQQIEAQKTHGMSIADLKYSFEDGHSTNRERGDTTISRVTSGVPSLHAVPLEQQLRSRQGSLESLRSERKVSGEKSRVTSWSDSDANTHGTANSSRGEYEQQRLSVIKESSHHITSTSRQRRPIHASWTEANDDFDMSPTDVLQRGRNMDGQRIYSALMNRLQETTDTKRGFQDKCPQHCEELVVQEIVPPRSSSRTFATNGDTMAATIKHVTAQENPCTDTSRSASAATVLHKQHPVANEMSNSHDPDKFDASASTKVNAPTASKTPGFPPQKSVSISTRSLTNPKVGMPASSGRALSERSSVFFGSPSCHLFRTQSPYRRAVRKSMQATADVVPPKSPEFNPWTKSLSTVQIRRPSACESDDDQKLAYDESVYSEDNEQVDVTPRKSRLYGKILKSPENHGDVTIFLDPPKYQPLTIRPSGRHVSSASSTEWKTWLSTNSSRLDHLEPPTDHSKTIGQGTGTPRFPWLTGHIRENAQISDEEDRVEARRKLATLSSASKASSTSQWASKGSFTTPYRFPKHGHRDTPPTSGYVHDETISSPSSMAARMLPSSVNSNTSKNNSTKLKADVEKHSTSPFQTKPHLQARSLSALDARNQDIVTPGPNMKKQQGSPKDYTPVLTWAPTAGSTDCEPSRLYLPHSSQIKVENISPTAAGTNDLFGSSPSGDYGAGISPARQGTGSKHMVELFLHSRRERVTETVGTDAFL